MTSWWKVMPWLVSIKWITAGVDVSSGVRPPVMGYRGQPGQDKGTLLTVSMPDHCGSPGDGGNPVPAVCIASRWDDEKKRHFGRTFAGYHKARGSTGMSLVSPSALLKPEEATHAGCLLLSIRNVELWETQSSLSFCTNCRPGRMTE